MKPLLGLAFLASVLVAAATVAWIVSHGRHELSMTRYAEREDGVQPFDPRCAATGLCAA